VNGGGLLVLSRSHPKGGGLFVSLSPGADFGKSRAGSEWIVNQALKHPYDRHGTPTEWHVIAETLSDARSICMEGPAGILRVLQRRQIKHRYVMSPKPKVIFPSGTKIYTEGADDPDVSRGANSSGAWLDEVCIAAGEPILTDRGLVPVEQVTTSDKVMTRTGLQPVSFAGLTKHAAETLRIRTTAGDVCVTPDHRVWVNDSEWRKAEDLQYADWLLTSTGEQATAYGVVKAGTRDVYDITVEGDAPEFYAGRGQLLVHNCKWRYPKKSWYEGIMPSLRADLMGDHPRAFVTTTPKPVDILQEWVQRHDGTVHIIRGSTFDNKANLSTLVVEELRKRYEGTAIGRQELYGEILEAFEGALFSRLDIANNRISDQTLVDEVTDKLTTIVVGVDPSLTGEDDEMGIVVVGRDKENHLYVLEDASVMAVGRAAALETWRVVARWGADKVICETNLGKRWMQQVFNDAYHESVGLGMFPEGTKPPIIGVDTKIGKKTRGEPVAMRCEQGRLHMVGTFPELEDQMATFTAWGSNESPDRLDALVHGCRYLMDAEKKQARITTPSDALSSTLRSLLSTGDSGGYSWNGERGF